MSVSHERIDLHPEYEGMDGEVHHWTAQWDLPEGEDPDEWREYVSKTAIYDRVLEPFPEGASFDVRITGRTLVATASLWDEFAPEVPSDRDVIGAEVIGIVQGLIGNF